MATSFHLSKPDYGIDAPPVIRNLTLAGSSAIVAGVIVTIVLTPAQPVIGTLLGGWGILAGIITLVSPALMVWSSKIGKLREREKLLDTVQWRGDELVVDVGCGRGLLLTAAARRLTTGKVVGINIWQAADQSGNRPENAIANARAEGIADRVELKTGDMRRLPFDGNAVDVVIASLSIHNLAAAEDRALAVREIARVVKPGGYVALLDFQKTDEYAQVLRDAGWQIEVSPLRWGMFPPVYWVTGRKNLA